MILNPKVKPLKFWSQKVLPLVYDNSLSYYEVLEKVVFKLNEVIEFVDTSISERISELIQQYFVDITYDSSDEQIDLTIGE